MPMTTICERSICDSFSSTTRARSSQPLTTIAGFAQRADFLAREIGRQVREAAVVPDELRRRLPAG